MTRGCRIWLEHQDQWVRIPGPHPITTIRASGGGARVSKLRGEFCQEVGESWAGPWVKAKKIWRCGQSALNAQQGGITPGAVGSRGKCFKMSKRGWKPVAALLNSLPKHQWPPCPPRGPFLPPSCPSLLPDP